MQRMILGCDATIFECAPFRGQIPSHPPLQQVRKCFSLSWRANAGQHQQISITQTATNQASPLHEEQVEKKQWVHFIGIGGAGLSALAFYALKQGWLVTGSDISRSEKLQELQKAGARVHIGHHASQLWGQDGKGLPDYVVLSAAIPSSNVELVEARRLGIQILSRGLWLASITRGYELIAISGSHGKSTTTAMLSMVLKDMGNNISAIVGADVPQFPGGGSVIHGTGSTFVLEADEYDGCFLSLSPQMALLTNIEWEHVDMFTDEASAKEHFKEFCMCLKAGGSIVFCGDSDAAKSVVAAVMQGMISEDKGDAKRYNEPLHQAISYGLGEGNIWQAHMITPNLLGGSDYLATCNGEAMTQVRIQVPGIHNVLNSLAVIATAAVLTARNVASNARQLLNAEKEAAKAASSSLQRFLGLRRRFEFVGMVEGCQIYDDYAHHPTEVCALLEAARQQFGVQPVWLVLQPHTYSRLARLLDAFAAALATADRVIVTEVYSAREKDIWGITGKDLVYQIKSTPAVYIPALDDVCAYLVAELATFQSDGAEGSVIVFTVGAGDISSLGPKLLSSLSRIKGGCGTVNNI